MAGKWLFWDNGTYTLADDSEKIENRLNEDLSKDIEFYFKRS
jgi:hypothetical protein